jgi:hypothetical protein
MELEKCAAEKFMKYFCSNVRGREHLRWKDNSEKQILK